MPSYLLCSDIERWDTPWYILTWFCSCALSEQIFKHTPQANAARSLCVARMCNHNDARSLKSLEQTSHINTVSISTLSSLVFKSLSSKTMLFCTFICRTQCYKHGNTRLIRYNKKCRLDLYPYLGWRWEFRWFLHFALVINANIYLVIPSLRHYGCL